MTAPAPNSVPRILLVGHCVPDSGMLGTAIRRVNPDAQVIRCNDDDELKSHLAGSSLLLVNRVLDGDFADTDGIALIKSLAGRNGTRLMLISNYADAQAAAEAAGAIPGFGKKSVFSEQAAARIRDAIASAPVAARALRD